MTGSYVTLGSGTFLGEIGANTHIAWTDGEYSSVSLIISDLNYLGIHNIRDGISDGAYGSAPLSHYIQLAEAGEKFTFMIGYDVDDNADIESVLSEISQVEQAVPGSVIAIEGPNEINNFSLTYDGTSGLQGALALQADLYADVKADASLAGVKVDYFTGYNAGTIAVGPTFSTKSGLADYDNQHPYPQFDQAPGYWVSRAAALGNTSVASTPAVYTETGYSSNNVSPTVQEDYTLDLLLDTAENHIAKTYLYDLLDAYAPGSPQGDDGYGLFSYTGAPKPVATGIHDLTTILRQTIAGGAHQPAGGVKYTIAGLPGTGNSLELIKPDTGDVIAVWAEPQLWNAATNAPVAAPTATVTITLDADYGTLAVYDPVHGTKPIETVTDASQITLSLAADPLLVEVSGGAPVVAESGHALCFARGTMIRVPEGERAVEALEIGDMVMTEAGARPIQWIGRRSYEGARMGSNPLMLPVCLRRGALAENVPCRDLWVSPGHGLWIDNILVPAWRLTNGVSIFQPDSVLWVDYFHIELAGHEILFAENCPAESYHDEGCRHIFANAASWRMTGDGAPAMALPRLEDGFHLRHIQRRLQIRAGMLDMPQGQNLRGYVDLAGPEILAGWAQNEDRPEVPVCLDVLLDGAYLTSLLANRYREDVRAAGLGSGTHGFELRLPRPGRVEVRRATDHALLPLAGGAVM